MWFKHALNAKQPIAIRPERQAAHIAMRPERQAAHSNAP